MLLEQDEARQFNLFKSSDSNSRSGQPLKVPDWLDLSQLEITNSSILYKAPSRDWVIGLDQLRALSNQRDQPIQLSVKGSLQDIAMTIDGEFGSVQSIFNRTDSVANLDATVAASSWIGVKGRIGDIIGWRDLDIALQASIIRLRDLSPVFSQQPLDITNLVAGGQLRQPETVSSMVLHTIDGEFSLSGIDMRATGLVGNLSKLEKIELAVEADSDIDLSQFPIKLPTGLMPKLKLSASLSGKSDRIDFEFSRAQFVDKSYRISTEGKVEDFGTVWKEGLPVKIRIEDLQQLGNQLGTSWPNVGAVMSDAILIRGSSGFEIDTLKINIESEELRLEGLGDIKQLGANAKGNLQFDAVVKPAFFDTNEYLLPLSPGEIRVKANLGLAAGLYSLNLENIESALEGATITGKGIVADLRQPDQLSIELKSTISSLPLMGEYWSLVLPDIEGLEAVAKLEGIDGQWDLQDITANGGASEKAFSITGNLLNIGSEMSSEFDFSLDTTINDVVKLIPALEKLSTTFAELDALKVQGKALGSADNKWALQDLEVRGDWLGTNLFANTNITSLNPLAGISQVKIDGELLGVPELLSNHQLPLINKLDVGFDIALSDQPASIENIDATISFDRARAVIKGGLNQLAPLKFEHLDVALEAEDLADLLRKDYSLQKGQAFKANITMQLNDTALSLDGGAQIGDSDFSGKVAIHPAFEDQSVKITVDGQSKILDLTEVFTASGKQDRVFSTSSLLPAFMRDTDGVIHLQAERFKNAAVALENLVFDADFSRNLVSVNIEGDAGEGKLQASVNYDQLSGSKISVEGDAVSVDAITSLVKGKMFEQGSINIDIALDGPGNSLASLVDQGQGHIHLDINESKLKNDSLNTVGGDLITNFISVLNPFDERKQSVNVECGAIRLDIRDGKAITTNGLALKTSRVTILGSGEIFFPAETLKIVVAPKPRKGFGINASSLAKVIRVGGSLSSPEGETDPTGFLKSGAAIGAAIVTGGLSLLGQGVLDRLRANSDVCAIARGEVAPAAEVIKDDADSR